MVGLAQEFFCVSCLTVQIKKIHNTFIMLKTALAALGYHLLIDLYKCDSGLIGDVAYVEKILVKAAKKARATIVNSMFHTFNPHGVSGVVVIAESHISVHTWPEYNFVSLDIYTCGNKVEPWKAFDVLREGFKAGYHTSSELRRGLLNVEAPQTPDVVRLP